MGKEIIREDKGYVSAILFNRPEKRNALNADVIFALRDTVRKTEEKRGEGDKKSVHATKAYFDS